MRCPSFCILLGIICQCITDGISLDIMDGYNQTCLPTKCLLDIDYFVWMNYCCTENIISCTVRLENFKVIKFFVLSYLNILHNLCRIFHAHFHKYITKP